MYIYISIGSDLVNQERSYTNVNNSTTTNNNDSNNNKDRKLTEESDRIGVGMRLQGNSITSHLLIIIIYSKYNGLIVHNGYLCF